MVLVSCVLPVYNEEYRIERTVRKVLRSIPTEGGFEVIIVDDGSADKSLKTIKKLCKKNPHVRFLTSKDNAGKGNALRRGILNSEGKFIVYLDADLDINPRIIRTVINNLKKYDIVIGSKYHNDSRVDYPFFRKIFSKVYSFIASKLFRVKISDFQCGIKGFNRKIILKLVDDVLNIGWSWDTEVLILASKQGCAIKELPVVVRNVYASGSNFRLWKDSLIMFRELLNIWRKQL